MYKQPGPLVPGRKHTFSSTLAVVLIYPTFLLCTANAQLAQPLYDAPGSVVTFKVTPDHPAILAGFGFYAEEEVEIVLRDGKLDAVYSKSVKEAQVFQIYTTKWKGISSAPYWEHCYDRNGNKTKPSVLAVLTDDGPLIGPCRNIQGNLPDGLPVVCSGGSTVSYFLFDESTPAGQYPLKPAPASSYQLPLLPNESARQGHSTLGLIALVFGTIAVVLTIGMAIIWRRKNKLKTVRP